MNYATLKTDIASGPLSASCVGKTDAQIAALFNALTGPGAASITLPSIPKNDFLKATTAAAVRCATGMGSDNLPLANGIAAKWNAVLAQAQAADPGSQIDLTLVEAGALGSPVTDRVMAQAEYDAMTKRTGSRFEVLFGAGVVASEQDIGIARNGI